MSEHTPNDAPVTSVSRGIREAVKEGLVNASETVRASIVASYVKEETEKRIKATTSVFEKIEALELELRKIKPTFAGFTLENKPVGEAIYTRDQVDQAKKANEQLEKLTKALELALTKNDFTKVFEVAK